MKEPNLWEEEQDERFAWIRKITRYDKEVDGEGGGGAG